jgi:glutathione peroxidase
MRRGSDVEAGGRSDATLPLTVSCYSRQNSERARAMKRILAALGLMAAVLASAGSVAGSDQKNMRATDFTFQSIDGQPMPLSTFKGKVLLVVNTASFCGFTKQYQGLQTLYDRYEAKGLVIIGVPSNDFGEQEPKSEGEIADFCKGAFGVTFPLTAKQTVSGGAAHPFYRWAATVLGAQNVPRWNFHKYLIGADGLLVAAFSTQTEPLSARLVSAIESETRKVTK